MTPLQRAYAYAGCKLSGTLALPELFGLSAAGEPAFRVALSASPLPHAVIEWSHNFPDASGRATVVCERTASGFRIHFPGVASLGATADGDISIQPCPAASPESVRHVLLDQALPRLLAQRGELVLHAAVVRTRAGRTLLLMGDSGRGKSTLTGAFFASGRAVDTDDGAVVRVRDNTLVATPTYPSLRLLPDSRAHLFADGDAETLPVADYTNKRRVPVPGALTSTGVDAIVLLAPPIEDDSSPRLSRETPGLACMAMIRHGFQLDLTDTANLQVLLAKAARAATLVPVYQLHYARRYEMLPQVIDLLEREA